MKKVFAVLILTLLLCPVVVIEAKTTPGKHTGYWQFDTTTTGLEMNVITVINKSEVPFTINNHKMIVSYKSSFWGWYTGVSDSSSDDVYYYVDDCDTYYRVVVHFNTNHSGDVQIKCYKVAEKRISYEAVSSGFAKFVGSVVCGIKSFFVGLFSGQPDYTRS